MNAIVFIQQYSIEKAREVVATYHGIPSYTFKEKTGRGYSACQSVDLSELKRLVKSVDLIGKYHSIDHAKNHYNNMREALNQYQYENKGIEDLSNELEQAIADYELLFCSGESK